MHLFSGRRTSFIIIFESPVDVKAYFSILKRGKRAWQNLLKLNIGRLFTLKYIYESFIDKLRVAFREKVVAKWHGAHETMTNYNHVTSYLTSYVTMYFKILSFVTGYFKLKRVRREVVDL